MQESFCRWGFNLYISSNEGDLCHSASDLPGQYKMLCIAPSSSLTLLDSSSSNRPSQHEMSTFNFCASVPLGVHSFTIYSILLDSLVLETSRLDV